MEDENDEKNVEFGVFCNGESQADDDGLQNIWCQHRSIRRRATGVKTGERRKIVQIKS